MSLKESVEQVGALLEEQPALERRAALAPVVTKLRKALADFLARAEPEIYKDTKEYAELSALLARPEYKETVTLDWLKRHGASVGLKLAKGTKKEKEAFAVALVKAGQASALIRELNESPRRKMQDLLNGMVRQSQAQVETTVKGLKPKQLEAFCEVNAITCVRNARGTIDRKQTLPHVFAKLAALKEYLKL
jgi:hypothetical protein